MTLPVVVHEACYASSRFDIVSLSLLSFGNVFDMVSLGLLSFGNIYEWSTLKKLMLDVHYRMVNAITIEHNRVWARRTRNTWGNMPPQSFRSLCCDDGLHCDDELMWKQRQQSSLRQRLRAVLWHYSLNAGYCIPGMIECSDRLWSWFLHPIFLAAPRKWALCYYYHGRP